MEPQDMYQRAFAVVDHLEQPIVTDLRLLIPTAVDHVLGVLC